MNGILYIEKYQCAETRSYSCNALNANDVHFVLSMFPYWCNYSRLLLSLCNQHWGNPVTSDHEKEHSNKHSQTREEGETKVREWRKKGCVDWGTDEPAAHVSRHS